ncbi:MAG: hypothetical protein R6U57_12550 [Anaerolineales bacterium]
MTSPALFFSFLLASLFGSGFHFWKGDGGEKLFLYLFLSWLGFALGHLFAEYIDFSLLMIGPISAGFGSIGSLFFLFLGHWTSRQLEEERP